MNKHFKRKKNTDEKQNKYRLPAGVCMCVHVQHQAANYCMCVCVFGQHKTTPLHREGGGMAKMCMHSENTKLNFGQKLEKQS